MLLAVLSSEAWGQGAELSAEEVARYEGHLENAAASFEREDYAAARRELERAYDLYPNPTIVFSIAGTYRREDQLEKALDGYRRFLSECATACRRDNGEQVRVANLTISELEKELAAADPPPPSPEKPVDAGRPWRWAGMGLAGIGVVALGAGGYFQLRASSLEGEIADELDRNGGMWTAALAAKESDGNSAQTRARIGLLAGCGAIALGTGLYLYGRSQRAIDESGKLVIMPTVTDQVAGLILFRGF